MRVAPLALAALLALTGCGGDEPEEQPSQFTPPAAQTRDTTFEDTLSEAAATTAPDDSLTPGATGRGEMTGEPGESAPSAGAAEGGSGAAESGSGAAAAGERLYTIQVAAFLEPATAEEWAGRLRSQGLPVWTSITEYQGRTFHRLRVGVVGAFSDARRLGAMVAERYEWPVWVAPVTPADPVPDDAVAATQRVLEGG